MKFLLNLALFLLMVAGSALGAYLAIHLVVVLGLPAILGVPLLLGGIVGGFAGVVWVIHAVAPDALED